MRNLLRHFLYIFFRILTRLTITGVKDIPLTGSCLVTINHLGIIDGPLVFCLLQREDATGLVALKHKEHPVIRFVVEIANGIWIDRTRTDFRAMMKACNYLKEGGLLGVAPEGTRSDSHTLIKAKPGVAFLAYKSNAVLVPVGITGSENALRKILTLQRPKVKVTFGKPYRLPRVARKDRDASLQRNTDEIMCRIAALLPETCRGFYADHPLLRALAGEDAADR